MRLRIHVASLLLLLASDALASDPGPVEVPAVAPDPAPVDERLVEHMLELEKELGEVVTASRTAESLLDAPASMLVITAEEIRQRGYISLTEVLMDLPGFDVSLSNGTTYSVAYQRGYRTSDTNRTLLMIDGKVENDLWTLHAELSRQYPLSGIDRIEVLYGPSSAVYGPNAFLGIINVITRQGAGIKQGGSSLQLLYGQYRTRDIDATSSGMMGDLSYSISAKVFRSDEPDVSARWYWVSNEVLGNKNTWGPMLKLKNDGVQLGSYHDPSENFGILASLSRGGLRAGVVHWMREEGYGAQYSGDRGQVNSFWFTRGLSLYGELDTAPMGKLQSHTLLSYRQSSLGGDWAEAEPDWNDGKSQFSYVSFTGWNSESEAWLLNEDVELPVEVDLPLIESLRLLAGFKYDQKLLTKGYDIPGYWPGSFSSFSFGDPDGPDGEGAAVVQSERDSYELPPRPGKMPRHNQVTTHDVGGYVLGIIDVSDFRLNVGLRHDVNSIYGKVTNPRGSVIYRPFEDAAIKLVYGTAFQEPSAWHLYGGWSGRKANPKQKPERARNGEVIGMLRTGRVFHDASAYVAHYDEVVSEEAENIGKRTIYGVEYKGRLRMQNPIRGSAMLTAYLYYTFTKAMSSVHFDFEKKGGWLEGSPVEVGDIAPHKIHLGLNVPLLDVLNVNLRGSWMSERTLYLRNALRDPSRPTGIRNLDGYFTLDTLVSAMYGPVRVGVKATNLLDAKYFHPGVEHADGGDDFTAVRSGGYRNSLIPQPGRSLFAVVSLDWAPE